MSFSKNLIVISTDYRNSVTMASTLRYETQHVSVEPLAQPQNYSATRLLQIDCTSLLARLLIKLTPLSVLTYHASLKAGMAERLVSWKTQNPVRVIPSESWINVAMGQRYGMIITGNTIDELNQLKAFGNTMVPRGCEFEAVSGLRAFKALGILILGRASHPGPRCRPMIRKPPFR